MRANYTVQKCSILQRQGETMLHSKTYYIAAMETDWDYAPNRTWEVEMFRGHQSPAPLYLDKQGGFIGSRYKKVVYRQFTNDKFTKQVERAADMEHLGIMGPMIHADVGDKVKVVFKNMASRPYSIHAHGVKTETPDVYDTKPGETHTYYWYVTKNTGPTAEQEDCTVAAYSSTTDVVKDMYSGLIGPLVICRRSWGRSLGLKKEVEEFALLFLIFNENESWYLDENIRTHITNPRANLKDDETFIESNRLHAINGYVYGNVLGLNMEVGDKVYWYLMGMGDDVSMHTAHWHGHNVEYKVGGGPHVTDVYELFPATFQTVKMRPQFPGTWLLHCHVTNHIKGGMEAMYTVTEKVTCQTVNRVNHKCALIITYYTRSASALLRLTTRDLSCPRIVLPKVSWSLVLQPFGNPGVPLSFLESFCILSHCHGALTLNQELLTDSGSETGTEQSTTSTFVKRSLCLSHRRLKPVHVMIRCTEKRRTQEATVQSVL
ncbi:hypothetical protein F2P81_005347 [Scophthalmus maximus]|uniref:ferroxidase n=1 Tax=Scophthalmus maximus TaxID=52904 RepID=A0A6A4T9D3_SCOMX|nr:hypothetical protein F2P81_005347 [Scophthalmus maximus]